MRFIIPGFGLTRRIRKILCLNLFVHCNICCTNHARHTAVGPKQQVHSVASAVMLKGGAPRAGETHMLLGDPRCEIVLAGFKGQESDISEVPGLAPYLQLSEMDWQYKAEPSSTSCLAMISNRCNLPRGKLLGGSSSINYMIYVRGNCQDYDNWEQLGNVGWGYKSVLPYFLKFEDNTNSSLIQEHATHNVIFPFTENYIFIIDPNSLKYDNGRRGTWVEVGEKNKFLQLDFNRKLQYRFGAQMTDDNFISYVYKVVHFKGNFRNAGNLYKFYYIPLRALIAIVVHSYQNCATQTPHSKAAKNEKYIFDLIVVVYHTQSVDISMALVISVVGARCHFCRRSLIAVVGGPVSKNIDMGFYGPLLVHFPINLVKSQIIRLNMVLRFLVYTVGYGLTAMPGQNVPYIRSE
ncbi:unnamed protein product, partial [Meganyctiphanes norvegica]